MKCVSFTFITFSTVIILGNLVERISQRHLNNLNQLLDDAGFQEDEFVNEITAMKLNNLESQRIIIIFNDRYLLHLITNTWKFMLKFNVGGSLKRNQGFVRK